MDSLHRYLLFFSLTYLLVAVGVNNFLHREGGPSFFTPDSFAYFSDAKWLLGETRDEASFSKPYRFVYPALSSVAYYFMRNEYAMVFVTVLSAVLAIHFFDLILKKVNFSEFERVVSTVLLLLSSVFTHSATHALTEATTLALGMCFVYLWVTKSNPVLTNVIFVVGLFTNFLMLAFLLAAIMSDWRNKNSLKWATPSIVLFVLGVPLFAYAYYRSYVLYAAEGSLFFTGILDRLAFFGKTLFMTTEPLLIFGVLGTINVFSKKVKSVVPELFFWISAFNALFVLSWSAPDVRFWAMSMPSFAFLSVYWLKKLERTEIVVSSAISVLFFKYYSYIGGVLGRLF